MTREKKARREAEEENREQIESKTDRERQGEASRER